VQHVLKEVLWDVLVAKLTDSYQEPNVENNVKMENMEIKLSENAKNVNPVVKPVAVLAPQNVNLVLETDSTKMKNVLKNAQMDTGEINKITNAKLVMKNVKPVQVDQKANA